MRPLVVDARASTTTTKQQQQQNAVKEPRSTSR